MEQEELETFEVNAGWDIQRYYDTVQIVRKDCSDCYGTGFDDGETCERCHGIGFRELTWPRDDIVEKDNEEYIRDEINATYAL